MTWRDVTWRDVTYKMNIKSKMLLCTRAPITLRRNFRGRKGIWKGKDAIWAFCSYATLIFGARQKILASAWVRGSRKSTKSKVKKPTQTVYNRALIIWTCVSFLQALELLPSSIEVREVYTFLLNVLEDKEKKRKNCQVLKSLLFAEHLQVGKIQKNLCSPLKRRLCKDTSLLDTFL